MKEQKQKKCRQCGNKFNPFNSTQVVCSSFCAMQLVVSKRKKREKKEHTQKKREFRLNDKSLQKKLAQASFNAYIRMRDRGNACIACSRHHTGQIHASHYRSTGSQPQLRFNEDNCHAGCQPCNTHLSGNLISYRINLVKKIGVKRVEFLEKEHEPIKYTIADFIAITRKYKCMTKELML